jgi:hypothetical protein
MNGIRRVRMAWTRNVGNDTNNVMNEGTNNKNGRSRTKFQEWNGTAEQTVPRMHVSLNVPGSEKVTITRTTNARMFIYSRHRVPKERLFVSKCAVLMRCASYRTHEMATRSALPRNTSRVQNTAQQFPSHVPRRRNGGAPRHHRKAFVLQFCYRIQNTGGMYR